MELVTRSATLTALRAPKPGSIISEVTRKLRSWLKVMIVSDCLMESNVTSLCFIEMRLFFIVFTPASVDILAARPCLSCFLSTGEALIFESIDTKISRNHMHVKTRSQHVEIASVIVALANNDMCMCTTWTIAHPLLPLKDMEF